MCTSTASIPKLVSSTSIFPNVPEHELRSVLRIYKSLPAKAAAVTDIFPGESMNSLTTKTQDVLDNPASASEIVRDLKNRMTEGSEKLRVDNEDIITDVLHHYGPGFLYLETFHQQY